MVEPSYAKIVNLLSILDLPKRAQRSNNMNSIAKPQQFKCNYYPISIQIKETSFVYLYSMEITPEKSFDRRLLISVFSSC